VLNSKVIVLLRFTREEEPDEDEVDEGDEGEEFGAIPQEDEV